MGLASCWIVSTDSMNTCRPVKLICRELSALKLLCEKKEQLTSWPVQYHLTALRKEG